MNFWATGESVAFVMSVIFVVSLYTEHTVTTVVCQALISLSSALVLPLTCPFFSLPCHLPARAVLSEYLN
jgi:hypothetical protein